MEANTPDTLGGRIARLRKEKGMTQLELADRMGVTDKAVSKWERDVSCPDIASMPRLAEVLGTTVDELITQCILGMRECAPAIGLAGDAPEA